MLDACMLVYNAHAFMCFVLLSGTSPKIRNTSGQWNQEYILLNNIDERDI